MPRADRMRALAAERGFTTIELMLAVFVSSVGIIALVGTFDVSRRLTSLSEMKEAASHVAQQKMEEIRALRYRQIAMNAAPASSTDARSPAYWVGGGGSTYRWDQGSDAPPGHTENLAICPTAATTGCTDAGQVAAAPSTWNDGRLSGRIHRYVTAVPGATCPDGTPCLKRVTVAVTVDNPGGPQKPILMSAIVANPAPATGSNNPLTAPDTKCIVDGQLTQCRQSIQGKVHTFYLYDTPATFSTRQEIAGSHPTRPTIAPSGTCTTAVTGGCPVPDLMGSSPPPATGTNPPLYSYSNEITGGVWPGGAVIRRDTGCDGTPTATDNTKGHMWVTAPLAAPMTVTGQASLNLSTATFNGVTAGVTLCVRFYNVPSSVANLVNTPPVQIGSASHTETSWPRTAGTLGFSIESFRPSGSGNHTIPQGNRLGVRIWVAASSDADIAAIYDHVLHPSFVQVNEAQ